MPIIASLPYACAQVFPMRHPRAVENDVLFTRPVLGVEVTEAALVARCTLGNIDPQHGGGGSGRSAIEAALGWPLPPKGAILATLRPDADALGAMAVLALRQRSVALGAEARQRIDLITAADNFDRSSWCRWVSLQPPLQRPGTVADVAGDFPDITAFKLLCIDPFASIDARVAGMARWLIKGELDADLIERAHARHAAVTEAWNDGEIVVERTADSRVVTIRSARPDALRIAYRFAPVVVAEGQVEGRRKLTVAQFTTGWIDMSGLKAALGTQESGWGGTGTILGSPQGASCRLSLSDVVKHTVTARLHRRLRTGA